MSKRWRYFIQMSNLSKVIIQAQGLSRLRYLIENFELIDRLYTELFDLLNASNTLFFRKWYYISLIDRKICHFMAR